MLSPLERLSRIRKALGFSQRDLAQEFGVSIGAVGLWETGEREIPGPVMKLIEFYESELFSSTRASDSAESTAASLVQTFAAKSGLSDAHLLTALQGALAEYVREWEGTTPMGGRIRTLALRQLIETLGQSRGIAMKVAQILSLVDPRIPAEVHSLFESIQTQGRAMPRQALNKIFTEEFDRSPSELFLEFSSRPVASASIGQVHQARLHDGSVVAVKVQHPDVSSKIDQAFSEFEFLEQLSLLMGMQLPTMQELIGDLHQTARTECDFEQEAIQQEHFRELFASDQGIKIPRVIASHSRRRVLTMEWIEGKSWTQFKQHANQAERDFAAQTISRFYAQSTFVHGIIQADPHPGNYIFQDGRIAVLDFGRVKKLTPHLREQTHRLHMLLMNGDRLAAADFVQSTDLFKVSSGFDFARFWEIATELTQHLRQDSAVPFSKDLLVRHRSLLKELGRSGTVQIAPEFFWTMIFTHTLMISGRVDLGASGNWRRILNSGSGEDLITQS